MVETFPLSFPECSCRYCWVSEAVCSFCIDCLIGSVVSSVSQEATREDGTKPKRQLDQYVKKSIVTPCLWSGLEASDIHPSLRYLFDEDGGKKENFSSSSHQLFLIFIVEFLTADRSAH